jgi:hypothetical protein
MSVKMKSHWRIALALIVILVLAGLIWNLRHSKNLTEIQATLPASEIAQIEKVVKRDLRKSFFKDYSWTSIKSVATHIGECLHPEMLSLNEISSSCVVVDAREIGKSKGGCIFVMTKRTNGWEIDTNHGPIIFFGGGFSITSSGDPVISLPETNSVDHKEEKGQSR